jgi:hypothetical protein
LPQPRGAKRISDRATAPNWKFGSCQYRVRRNRLPSDTPEINCRHCRILTSGIDSGLRGRLARLPDHHVGPRLDGRPRGNRSSGSLAKFTGSRSASSRVSRFGRRAVRRSDTSGIGGEAEARGLRFQQELFPRESISRPSGGKRLGGKPPRTGMDCVDGIVIWWIRPARERRPPVRNPR